MKHIRMFEDSQSATQVLSTLSYNTLSAIRGESGVTVTKVEHIGPDTPFYIDVRGTVAIEVVSGLQMSTDGRTWEDTKNGDLPTGKTYFRVASDQEQEEPLYLRWTEDEDSDYDIGGNINSLVKVNFENDTNCYGYASMFNRKQHLKSAGNLILPATELTESCYQGMFSNCTSLIAAPELPATTLAPVCYAGMFEDCTALTTAPELPATTLAPGCYAGMFEDCTALTTAPAILPATTLGVAEECYSNMFHNCNRLTMAPELPATTLVGGCYMYMFEGCTSLTAAPELPATILAPSCYNSMFQRCTSLNYIKCLATDISASSCTSDWISDVSSTGTFIKNPAISVSDWRTGEHTGNSGIPEGWTVEDAA